MFVVVVVPRNFRYYLNINNFVAFVNFEQEAYFLAKIDLTMPEDSSVKIQHVWTCMVLCKFSEVYIPLVQGLCFDLKLSFTHYYNVKFVPEHQ